MYKKIIKILIIALIFHYIFIRRNFTPKNFKLTLDKTKTLSNDPKILNEKGELKEAGYSFKNRKEMNIDGAIGAVFGIKALNPLRWKKFDCYNIIDENEAIQMCFSDIGFLSNVFFKHWEFSTKTGKKTDAIAHKFGDVSNRLIPDTHTIDGNYATYFNNSGHVFSTTDRNGERVVSFSSKMADFELKFKLKEFNREGLIDVTPLADHNRTWFYTEKFYNMPFEAKIKEKYKGKSTFRKIDTTKMNFGIDIGRGLYNYQNDYYWFSGGKSTPDVKYSWTLQRGFTNAETLKSHQDFFFFNEKATQLHPVVFDLEDHDDPKKGVKIYTNDEKLRKDEAPGTMEIVLRVVGNMDDTLDLKLICVSVNHFFGAVDGWFVDRDGKKHVIESGYASLEKFYSKW